MRVLVACEYSATVRDAFRARGHDAWSCDLLPTEGDPRWHHQGSVFDIINEGWDLMINHPPCTDLAVSGTDVVDGREARIHKMPPVPDRWKERSRTFKGIAEAMADQWGNPREDEQPSLFA